MRLELQRYLNLERRYAQAPDDDPEVDDLLAEMDLVRRGLSSGEVEALNRRGGDCREFAGRL